MNVATFPPPSLPIQLAELKRERKMRERVYPYLISSKKLRQTDADYQNRGLNAAIATLEALVLAGADTTVQAVLINARVRFAKGPT